MWHNIIVSKPLDRGSSLITLIKSLQREIANSVRFIAEKWPNLFLLRPCLYEGLKCVQARCLSFYILFDWTDSSNILQFDTKSKEKLNHEQACGKTNSCDYKTRPY